METTMICKHCGSEHDARVRFCPSCGLPAAEPAARPHGADLIICPGCRAPIAPSDAFCRQCGAPLAPAVAIPPDRVRAVPSRDAPKPSASGPPLAALMVMVLVLASIALAWFVLKCAKAPVTPASASLAAAAGASGSAAAAAAPPAAAPPAAGSAAVRGAQAHAAGPSAPRPVKRGTSAATTAPGTTAGPNRARALDLTREGERAFNNSDYDGAIAKANAALANDPGLARARQLLNESRRAKQGD